MRKAMLLGVLACGLAGTVAAAERTPEERALDAAARFGFEQAAGEMSMPPAALTVTATAVGCHWRFDYAGPAGTARFDPATAPCLTRLCPLGLDPDHAAPVPVGTHLRLRAKTEDKLRVLSVPPLGLQIEAVPGKTNEVWLEVKEAGIYPARQGADCGGDPRAVAAAFRGLDRRGFDEWLAAHRNGR